MEYKIFTTIFKSISYTERQTAVAPLISDLRFVFVGRTTDLHKRARTWGENFEDIFRNSTWITQAQLSLNVQQLFLLHAKLWRLSTTVKLMCTIKKIIENWGVGWFTYNFNELKKSMGRFMPNLNLTTSLRKVCFTRVYIK